MNRTKIDWCDYTWNPITGCLNGCSYCYARRISNRFVGHFKPTFHKDRLEQPFKVKKPSLIFADSMSDFWGKGVRRDWRDEVYNVMNQTRQHTYFLLTKQPQKITDMHYEIPENCFVGVSVTCFDDRWRVPKLITNTGEHVKHFVSVEPLLDNIVSDYIYLVDWVIVGCLTGVGSKKYKPKKETIDEIVSNCKRLGIPVFIKGNCSYPEQIQEYPKLKDKGE